MPRSLRVPGWLRVRDGSMRVRDELLSLGLLTHLLAFVALPALHLVAHAPDHEHGPGGEVIAHQQPSDGPSAPDAPTPAHGEGSAAHLAAAYGATTLFVFVPCLAPLGEARRRAARLGDGQRRRVRLRRASRTSDRRLSRDLRRAERPPEGSPFVSGGRSVGPLSARC